MRPPDRPLAAERLETRALLSTTATMSFDSTSFARIPVTFRKPDGAVGWSGTASVGQLSWSGMTGSASTVGVPANFTSFCIEGLQSVAPGSNTFATVGPASASPLLGAGRARSLEDFWRQFGPSDATGFADKTDSAAFQLAVWEIINDGLPAKGSAANPLAAGQFSVGSAGLTTSAAVRALRWFDGFDPAAPGRNSVALYALHSPTRQDQVVCVPVVDLDVDSDNTGSVARSSAEEHVEEAGVTALNPLPTGPGAILPVGGVTQKMVVDVPRGRTATLQLDAAAARRVRVWADWGEVLNAQTLSATFTGGETVVWIESVAGSTSLADVVFTLTTSDGGPASSDTVRATVVDVNVSTDSDNDGDIDRGDDRVEEEPTGHVVFANTDDDDHNGVADLLDVGRVAVENDLSPIVIGGSHVGHPGLDEWVVNYDQTFVRLYRRPDRTAGVVTGTNVRAGDTLYAEGRGIGTTLVEVALRVNARTITDTIRLTVMAPPTTIDVDVDSDNTNVVDNYAMHPSRTEWEDLLEDHPYAIGKLIMLDNPGRDLAPIVLQLPPGLPWESRSLRVRLDWNDAGPAGSVRLWNSAAADHLRNPTPVEHGGNLISPGRSYALWQLNYDPDETGKLFLYAEGIAENPRLKTLAGVEAAPPLNERIRATLVVNGDDVASDEVKYVVTNEDSFYYALHTRQEVRNALAARGVYAFDDLQKFGLQARDPVLVGVDVDVARDIGPNPRVPGLKAMIYQDYITGRDQFVLAFGGTDDKIWELEFNDWLNNIKQGLGWSAPQYTAALKIGEAVGDAVGPSQLIVAGHSLGGGLASAAALVAGSRADTFNAAGLHEYTLYKRNQNDEPILKPTGGYVELYPGSAARYMFSPRFISAYYVDYEILDFVQGFIGRTAIGDRHEMDGHNDMELAMYITGFAASVVNRSPWHAASAALSALDTMVELHSPSSMLYGLLVKESSMGGIKVDMLGYSSFR